MPTLSEPSDDIVDELRRLFYMTHDDAIICAETAADEIEQLRATVYYFKLRLEQLSVKSTNLSNDNRTNGILIGGSDKGIH